MVLNQIEWIMLDRVREFGADLRKLSELRRQVIITLGMAEPPLVDVRADEVFITDAGRTALKAQPNY